MPLAVRQAAPLLARRSAARRWINLTPNGHVRLPTTLRRVGHYAEENPVGIRCHLGWARADRLTAERDWTDNLLGSVSHAIGRREALTSIALFELAR